MASGLKPWRRICVAMAVAVNPRGMPSVMYRKKKVTRRPPLVAIGFGSFTVLRPRGFLLLGRFLFARRPRRRDVVHPRVGDRLTEVLVHVRDHGQTHCAHGGGLAEHGDRAIPTVVGDAANRRA